MKELINRIAIESKPNRLETNKYENLVFQSVVINGTTTCIVPTKYKRIMDIPLLFIWKLKGGTYCAWHQIIYFDMCSASRPMMDYHNQVQGYIINSYYLNDIQDFNVEQAISMLDNTYNKIHDRFIDSYSEQDFIFLTYRDRFDDKRYQKVIEDFEWYFYIKKNEYDKMLTILNETNLTKAIKFVSEEQDWLRIHCDNYNSFEWSYKKNQDPTWRIKEALKGRMDTFEADLSPASRYAIDMDLKIETDLKILYFDIETDDSAGNIDMDANAILSIGMVDNRGNEFWKALKDEKALINWFMDIAKDYDIYMGYNSYNFDAPYIQIRAKLNGIYWKPNHKNFRAGHIDMMRRLIGTYGRHSDLKSFSLDNVSNHFIGTGKVKFDGKIIDLFNNDRKTMKEYNLEDCRLLLKLDNMLGVTKLMIAMCDWTGTFPTVFKATSSQAGISLATLLDMYILRSIRGRNVHYPTQIWEKKEGEKFEGGLVMEPDPGLYNNVRIFDFKSLYPMIIWGWKISPENVTYSDDTTEELTKSPIGVYFYKNRDSIFPSLVDKLMVARNEYKTKMNQVEAKSQEHETYDIMQKVTKELTNALYGLLGQKGNRYFNHNVAGSVTAAGRNLLLKTKELCEELGIKVIYGDTDSVFLTYEEDVQEKHLINYLNGALRKHIHETFNAEGAMIELEYEKKIKKFVIVGGKNYAGQLSVLEGEKVDKTMIKGLDCVKRNTIKLIKEAQEELIDKLLKTDNPSSYYVDWMTKLKEKFYSDVQNVEDIMIKTSISKMPNEYKNKTPHVRVAEKLIAEKKEFWIGMQIPYIITDKKNKGVVHVDEYNGVFDKDHYWSLIYKAMGRLLEVSFKDVNWPLKFYKVKKTRKKKVEPKKGGFIIQENVPSKNCGFILSN